MWEACGNFNKWLGKICCAAWVQFFFPKVALEMAFLVLNLPGCRLCFPSFENLGYLLIFCKYLNLWI